MIDPRALATDQLAPGERLLWSGSSDPGTFFTGRDGFLVPFSLFWCGFVVFWNIEAWSSDAPLPFALFGSVFLLMGLHLLVGRFFVKAHRKRTEAYAVTDRRVFVTNGRTTRDTSSHRTDRTVHWSGGRKRCTVQWEGRERGFNALFGWNGSAAIYANTGLDGFFGPRTMAFWDVRDGDGLMRALDQVVAQPS